jgi:hypothetical protein
VRVGCGNFQHRPQIVAKLIMKMKEHPDFKGYYITPDGRVFSCVKRKYGIVGRGTSSYIDVSEPVELTPYTHNDNGYVYVGVGKYGHHRLHRLVAQTYIENPCCLPEVNHIDEDKTNNNVSNLEWCTRQENAEHSLSKTYLVECIATGEQQSVFNLSEFCREHKLSVGSLRETLTQQRRKQHKGFKVISVL